MKTTFNVNKRRQVVFICIWSTLLVCYLLATLFLIPSSMRKVKGGALFGSFYWIYTITVAIRDTNDYIELDSCGLIIMHRGKKHAYSWKSIKRLEYSKGIVFLPTTEVLYIHTSNSKFYVDSKFLNYKDVWSKIVEYYEYYSESPIIDADVPRKER